jgi:hypothetical protein
MIPAYATRRAAAARRALRRRGPALAFARGHNPWVFDSPEHWVPLMETRYGPTVKARA